MIVTEKRFLDPQILGITWIPGELVLVGARPGCGKTCYVLGNCIVEGTKGLVPAAYFMPGGNMFKITKKIIEMTAGETADKEDDNPMAATPEYPLYIDCTSHLTIEYLIDRIFHFVKEYGVKMVVIDYLQKVDGGVFSAGTREMEMKSILCLLKNLAESLGLVVIVTSQLSESIERSNQTPQAKDILYVPFAEELCDQIVLIKSMGGPGGAYQLILPKGFTIYDGEYGEMTINAVFDTNKCYFRKAGKPFYDDIDDDYIPQEEPAYKWYFDDSDKAWLFNFLDSSGGGWTITISPCANSQKKKYDIYVTSWENERISLAQFEPEPGHNLNKLKAFALREARCKFPDVEIPERE